MAQTTNHPAFDPEPPEWKKDVHVPRTPQEKAKARVEKLMKNPAKLAYIPEKGKTWEPKKPPEFIRHVWGSAWGAGSGDFHIYRGIRRREGIRQKHREEVAIKEQADVEYDSKLQKNREGADTSVAKRQKKRDKKKAYKKAKRSKKTKKVESSEEESESDEEEEAEKTEAAATPVADKKEEEERESKEEEVVEERKKNYRSRRKADDGNSSDESDSSTEEKGGSGE